MSSTVSACSGSVSGKPLSRGKITVRSQRYWNLSGVRGRMETSLFVRSSVSAALDWYDLRLNGVQTAATQTACWSPRAGQKHQEN